MALAACMSLILAVMILTSCKSISAEEKAKSDSSAKKLAENIGEKAVDEAVSSSKSTGSGIISNIIGKTVMNPECKKASLSIIKISGKKELCIYKDTINLGVINDGEIALAGIDLYVKGEKSNEVAVRIREGIGTGSASRQFIMYDSEKYGELEQIRAVPVIKVDGEESVCSEKGLEEEDIEACG